MNPYTHYRAMIPACVILVMALYLLCIGLRGLLRGTPFVLSTRWGLGLMGFVFGAQLGAFALSAIAAKMSLLIEVAPFLLIFVLLAIFAWRTGYGYGVYGVTLASLHEGLLGSLKSLGLSGEDHFGGIRIPTLQTSVEASVRPIGTGWIRIERNRHRKLLRDIAAAMNRYYSSSKIPAERTLFYCMTAFGLALGGLGIFFVLRFQHPVP